jgi:hypothetical protein
MSLTLDEVRRIAQEVATARDPNLQVVSASTAEGGSAYTEVMVTVDDCAVEPCRLVIGVDRTTSESLFRETVDEQLRERVLPRLSR